MAFGLINGQGFDLVAVPVVGLSLDLQTDTLQEVSLSCLLGRRLLAPFAIADIGHLAQLVLVEECSGDNCYQIDIGFLRSGV